MNMNGSTNTNINTYTDPNAAAVARESYERTIVQRWKAPARAIAININAAPWDSLVTDGVPEQYRAILSAVLEGAAKSILKRHVESFNTTPATLSSALFTAEALIEEATSGASEWMSKEELTEAWNASVTRRVMILDNQKYKQSASYRRAANAYSELILKLAGKTSAYEPEDLDWLLAKFHEADLNTELGTFLVRRVEMLQRKPQRPTIDRDAL
jgi:hypothetical protein